MIEEPKISAQAKGTRILTGDLARRRREIINDLTRMAETVGFQEIVLPTIEQASLYTTKAGKEILDQMYVFKDRGDRDLCLRPEGTATCQMLAREQWKMDRDIKVWYVTQCFRYEQPQAGRYREFTQFGVEVLNPRKPDDEMDLLIILVKSMMATVTLDYKLTRGCQRGLAYYDGGVGFEVSIEKLGAQKQVCGGGRYAEGLGFAIGIDRLMLV